MNLLLNTVISIFYASDNNSRTKQGLTVLANVFIITIMIRAGMLKYEIDFSILSGTVDDWNDILLIVIAGIKTIDILLPFKY